MCRERIFLFLSFFLSSFLRRATTTSKSLSIVSVFRLRRVDDELNAGKRSLLRFQRRKGFWEKDFS